MFCFNMRAYNHIRPEFLEIRMEFWFDENPERQTLTEIIPKDRFFDDEKYSKYVIDSMFDKSKQMAWMKLTDEANKKTGLPDKGEAIVKEDV